MIMTSANYKNWKLEFDKDNVLWLLFDREDQPVNSFNTVVMSELDEILDEILRVKPAGVVIASIKKTGYIAGADITQFTDLKNEEQAFKLIRQGQLVFDKLEQLPMPTVALINGFCLGGGYEMALACRYRIALKDPKVKIGLPEVKLGLQPGWGGTVRLPKLIGPLKSMQIILPGAAVSASKARRPGMVDAIVPERQLKRAASYYIQKTPATRSLKWLDKICGLSFVRPWVGKLMYKQLAAKNVSKSHYPAPFAIIDRWVKDFGRANAMENEAKSISKLMMTDTCRQLLRVFFLQNSMKELTKGVKFKAQHVHVIGAGTMGGDIAAWCALQGMHVTLQDQSADKIGLALKSANKLFRKKLKDPVLINQARDRLQPDQNGLGVRSADVIIEAVFEHLVTKQKIFKHLEEHAKEEAILATNTSSIPLDKISQVMDKPGRLIGVHFFNPVAKMPLVEIVKTSTTPQLLIKKAASFVKQLKRSPLAVMSSPGFLVNRLLMPYLAEAMKMYEEGIAKELIDQAAIDFGMPMGPVELADRVGLDVCLSVAQNLSSCSGMEVSPKLEEMVEAGSLGFKTGNGFYRYDKKGKPIRQSRKSQPLNDRTRDITDRLVLILLNEAVACLHEKVVSNADLLDAGMIFGTGFAPFRGGPMQYAKERGINDVVFRLKELSSQYGERFQPKDGWQQLMQQNNDESREQEASLTAEEV
jgi:3-hydroxyacyl-CoA dehydrogenase / enoyl-CoA hydratase / 3-hydroxybutyryl-CoA epimerase